MKTLRLGGEKQVAPAKRKTFRGGDRWAGPFHLGVEAGAGRLGGPHRSPWRSPGALGTGCQAGGLGAHVPGRTKSAERRAAAAGLDSRVRRPLAWLPAADPRQS